MERLTLYGADDGYDHEGDYSPHDNLPDAIRHVDLQIDNWTTSISNIWAALDRLPNLETLTLNWQPEEHGHWSFMAADEYHFVMETLAKNHPDLAAKVQCIHTWVGYVGIVADHLGTSIRELHLTEQASYGDGWGDQFEGLGQHFAKMVALRKINLLDASSYSIDKLLPMLPPSVLVLELDQPTLHVPSQDELKIMAAFLGRPCAPKIRILAGYRTYHEGNGLSIWDSEEESEHWHDDKCHDEEEIELWERVRRGVEIVHNGDKKPVYYHGYPVPQEVDGEDEDEDEDEDDQSDGSSEDDERSEDVVIALPTRDRNSREEPKHEPAGGTESREEPKLEQRRTDQSRYWLRGQERKD